MSLRRNRCTVYIDWTYGSMNQAFFSLNLTRIPLHAFACSAMTRMASGHVDEGVTDSVIFFPPSPERV